MNAEPTLKICAEDRGAWKAESGLAQVEFSHSLVNYWLEYVPEGEKFARAIVKASPKFVAAFGYEPQFALVRQIPPGAEEFAETKGVILVQSTWVQEHFVVLGSYGTQEMKAGFKKWRKVNRA